MEAVKDLFVLFAKSRQAIRSTLENKSLTWTKLGANISMLFALGKHQDAQQWAAVQRALYWEDRAYWDPSQQDLLQPDNKDDSAVSLCEKVDSTTKIDSIHNGLDAFPLVVKGPSIFFFFF